MATPSCPSFECVPIAITGGILLVAIVSLLTKSVVDAKDADLKSVVERCNEGEKELQTSKATLDNAINEIRDLLKELDATQLDPLTAARIRHAIQLSERFPDSIDRDKSDCRSAGEWLRRNKGPLMRSSLRESLKMHPRLILRIKPFIKDISDYIDWICACLQRGGARSTRLTDFVSSPSILPVTPYITAFEYIKKQQHWEGLTFQQKNYLIEVIEKLLIILRKKY